jgi:pantothenate kinase
VPSLSIAVAVVEIDRAQTVNVDMFAFTLQCCASPPASPACVAKAIAQCCLADPRFPQYVDDDRYVLGIAGIPGSGKTTTAKALASLLQEHAPNGRALTLSMDGWHYTRKELDLFPDGAAAHARRGAPWTFDASSFASALRTCKESPSIVQTFPSFSHALKDPVQSDIEILPDCRVVVLEGNYLGYDGDPDWVEVRSYIDKLIFVDCPIDVAMDRVVARHVTDLGLSVDAAKQRVRDNDHPNALLVQATIASADLIVEQTTAIL